MIYEKLIQEYYSSSNVFIRKRNLNEIIKYVQEDYRKVSFVKLGFPETEVETSGIVYALPGGRKKRNDLEDELVQEILLSLNMPYDDKYIYKHKNLFWSKLVALLKSEDNKRYSLT